MPKNPKRALNKVLELVETLMRKSPCMRKYCSSQFTLCNISIVQVPIHPATCFAAQVAFVLGTRVFIRSTKVEICHVLHPWTVMWRTAVQPLPPKNLRRFASRDLDGVFDGVWVSGFWLLPAAISLATFWCLLFKVSVGTNKRSRAFRCHNEAPTNSRNFKRSDWIKTGNHHATSWIIYMIYNI